MKRLIIASALVSLSCGFAGAPNSRIPSFPTHEISSCLVQVHKIPDVHGSGWIWVESSTQGTCGDGPKWSITPGEIYHHPEDPPTIMYFGGPNGIYHVVATYEFGVGQVDISIEN